MPRHCAVVFVVGRCAFAFQVGNNQFWSVRIGSSDVAGSVHRGCRFKYQAKVRGNVDTLAASVWICAVSAPFSNPASLYCSIANEPCCVGHKL